MIRKEKRKKKKELTAKSNATTESERDSDRGGRNSGAGAKLKAMLSPNSSKKKNKKGRDMVISGPIVDPNADIPRGAIPLGRFKANQAQVQKAHSSDSDSGMMERRQGLDDTDDEYESDQPPPPPKRTLSVSARGGRGQSQRRVSRQQQSQNRRPNTYVDDSSDFEEDEAVAKGHSRRPVDEAVKAPKSPTSPVRAKAPEHRSPNAMVSSKSKAEERRQESDDSSQFTDDSEESAQSPVSKQPAQVSKSSQSTSKQQRLSGKVVQRKPVQISSSEDEMKDSDNDARNAASVVSSIPPRRDPSESRKQPPVQQSRSQPKREQQRRNFDTDDSEIDDISIVSDDGNAQRRDPPPKEQPKNISIEPQGRRPRNGPEDVSRDRVGKLKQKLRVSTNRDSFETVDSSDARQQKENSMHARQRSPVSPNAPRSPRLNSPAASPASASGSEARRPLRGAGSQSPHRNAPTQLNKSLTIASPKSKTNTAAQPRRAASESRKAGPTSPKGDHQRVMHSDSSSQTEDSDDDQPSKRRVSDDPASVPPTSVSPPNVGRTLTALDPSKRTWAAKKRADPVAPSALDKLEGKVPSPASMSRKMSADRKSLQRKSSDLELWNMDAMLAEKKELAEKQRALALAKADELARVQAEQEEREEKLRENQAAAKALAERLAQEEEEMEEAKRLEEEATAAMALTARSRSRSRSKSRVRTGVPTAPQPLPKPPSVSPPSSRDSSPDSRHVSNSPPRKQRSVQNVPTQLSVRPPSTVRRESSLKRDSSPVRQRPPRTVSMGSSEQSSKSSKSPVTQQPQLAKQVTRPPRGPESTQAQAEATAKSPETLTSPVRLGRAGYDESEPEERTRNPRLSSLSLASSQRSSMISIPERRSSMLSMSVALKSDTQLPSPLPPQPAKKFNWASAPKQANEAPLSPLNPSAAPITLLGPDIAPVSPLPKSAQEIDLDIDSDSSVSTFDRDVKSPVAATVDLQQVQRPPRGESKTKQTIQRPPRGQSSTRNEGTVSKGGSSGKQRRVAPPPRSNATPQSPDMPPAAVISEVPSSPASIAAPAVPPKPRSESKKSPVTATPPSKPAAKVVDMWEAFENEALELEQLASAHTESNRHSKTLLNMFEELDREASVMFLQDPSAAPNNTRSMNRGSKNRKIKPSPNSTLKKGSMKPWKPATSTEDDLWKLLEDEALLLKDVLEKPAAPVTEQDRIRVMEERALRKLAQLEEKCNFLKELVKSADEGIAKREAENEAARNPKAAEKPSLLASLFKSTPKESVPILKHERSPSNASQAETLKRNDSVKSTNTGASKTEDTTLNTPQPLQDGLVIEDMGSASPVAKSGFLNRLWKRNPSNAQQTTDAIEAIAAAAGEKIPGEGQRKGSNASVDSGKTSIAAPASPILKNGVLKSANVVDKPSSLKESAVMAKPSVGRLNPEATALDKNPTAKATAVPQTAAPTVASKASKNDLDKLKQSAKQEVPVKKPESPLPAVVAPADDVSNGNTVAAAPGEKKTVLGWLFGGKKNDKDAAASTASTTTTSTASAETTAVVTASGPVGMSVQQSSDGESISSKAGQSAAERSAERRKKWAELKKETEERGANSPVTWTRKQSDDEGSDSTVAGGALSRSAERRASAIRKKSDAGLAGADGRSRTELAVSSARRSPSRRRDGGNE
ncbi:hypothetical protein HDU78_011006 [Chytriomyces hyalinus]|nr:hypothetical protein HDU78_011006 [Chytriomyces hyalinus]